MSRAKIVSLAKVTLFFSLSACSIIKANPAPHSGFLPHAEFLKPLPERSPFNAVWYKNRAAFYELKKGFTNIYIAPVNTVILEAKLRKERLSKSSLEYRIEELKEFGRYAETRLKERIKDFPQTNITVVSAPGPKTLVLEMALVELSPTIAAVNLLGTISSFFIPGSGLVKSLAKGSIAMETIIRNGENNEILVEVKDREIDKSAPFTIRDFAKYAHARKIIDEWAEIFAELSATDYDHKVDGLLPITINPL